MFGFELLETSRYLSLLRPGATVVVNDFKILPPAVLLGQAVYPEGLADSIRTAFPDTLLVDGQRLAIEAGDLRAANTALLGAVSKRLAITDDIWRQALEKMVPRKALEINLMAFQMGRDLKG